MAALPFCGMSSGGDGSGGTGTGTGGGGGATTTDGATAAAAGAGAGAGAGGATSTLLRFMVVDMLLLRCCFSLFLEGGEIIIATTNYR